MECRRTFPGSERAIGAYRVLLLLVFLFAVSGPLGSGASASTIPRYNMGSVPDQTVWSGSSREFLLHWDNRVGVLMSVEATPLPDGLLTLEPVDDTNWHFRFEPDDTDTTPIRVEVTAIDGGQQLTYRWELVPQAVLRPEADFFSSGPHTQSPIPPYGVSVFDLTDPLPVFMNYGQRNVHQVRIVGEIVEIEVGHANGLYEAYFDGGRRDIRAMEIIAERIVFRSPARLKQTAVSLSARELVFEGDGQIQTTPEEQTQSAGTNNGGGIAGVDGLPGGNIFLEVGEIVADGPGVRFDLTGGQGQPGGPGQHGANGSSIATSWSSVRYCDSGICKTHTPAANHRIIYWRYMFLGIKAAEGGGANSLAQ